MDETLLKSDKKSQMEKLLLETTGFTAANSTSDYNMDEVRTFKMSSMMETKLRDKPLKPGMLDDINFQLCLYSHSDGYHWYAGKKHGQYHFCLPLKSASPITDYNKFLSECQTALDTYYLAILSAALKKAGFL